jgi:hypothetical protein
MSIDIIGKPSLFLQYVDPVFDIPNQRVVIKSSLWNGRANVRVRNEQGKKWRIGFVQVLHRNEMVALYKDTRVEEVVNPGHSLPILDGPNDAKYRPFYDGPPEMKKVKIAANAAQGTEQTVETTMYDAPESPSRWYHNNDVNNPLQEFIMFLTFSTYIVAQDYTGGKNPPLVLRILKQWDVVLDRRFRFDFTNPLQPRTIIDSVNARQPLISMPPQFDRPSDTLLMGAVANMIFAYQTTPRQNVRVSQSVRGIAARFGGI